MKATEVMTLTELMRIKKELTTTIAQSKNQLRYKKRLGLTAEDGICIDANPDENSIDRLNKLKEQFTMLCAISNLIERINLENSINDLIRNKANLEYEREFFNSQMELFTPKTTQKRVAGETVGTVKLVTINYTPFLTKKEAKDKVKNIKVQLREVQSKIDKVNSLLVPVTFTHADIDELLLID